MSRSRSDRDRKDLDVHFDLWSDVNQPGAMELTLRNVHSSVALVVKKALERDGWEAEIRPATKGPQARADRLLPPML